MSGSLWIDVEDMFEYAQMNTRPSGIQRLAFEVYRALHVFDGDQGCVHFVRHAFTGKNFRVVPWSELESLFVNLTDETLPTAPHPATIQPPTPHAPGAARELLRFLLQRIPSSFRPEFIDTLLTSASAARSWTRLISTILRKTLQAPSRIIRKRRIAATVDRRLPAAADLGFDNSVSPGDVILVLGSPWSYPDYAALIRAVRDKHRMRVAILVYDLIPIRRPEWCDRNLVRLFRIWFDTMLPLSDHVFTISKATAADLQLYLAERDIALPSPIIPLPIGTGLSTLVNQPTSNAPTTRILPPPGSYALLVSTIEARKNHLLMFRVWRRLLEDLPHDQVPTLVFAGRVGWLVDDLMRQISNTANLDGKLIILESPTDAELVALYNGCLFTLFPSFYEGWGLPVTESLALGKPCLMSNRTSLPEAGGNLARSFDPDNLNDAYAAIRNVIDDRKDLAHWQQQVRREFQPVPWSATIEALLAGLALNSTPAAPDICSLPALPLHAHQPGAQIP